MGLAAVGTHRRGTHRRGTRRRGMGRRGMGRATEGCSAVGRAAVGRAAVGHASVGYAAWVAPRCGSRRSVGRAAVWDAPPLCVTAHLLCYLCAILSAIFAIFEDSPR